MSYHRFKVDQTVVASAPTLPFGRYTILRLLPLVNGEPRYRVKGVQEAFERAVLQTEIRLPDRRNDGSPCESVVAASSGGKTRAVDIAGPAVRGGGTGDNGLSGHQGTTSIDADQRHHHQPETAEAAAG
jgi:hypothetical protein